MRILHICWGLSPTNGAANIARMIMREQQAEGNEVSLKSAFSPAEISACDELWCHCGWYWRIWSVVRLARRLGKKVYWMPECCYDPVRLRYHGWKKWLVGPWERSALRKCDALVATCEAEAEWIRAYVGLRCPTVVISDIKRFFSLPDENCCVGKALASRQGPLRVLYLGRNHPLKGVTYLEKAVRSVGAELHVVNGKTGVALEEEWTWADVLCLPTLSDNFGLVVAEALERGKPVVTTDGAPAWESQPGVVYLKGFREGTDNEREGLLTAALESLMN